MAAIDAQSARLADRVRYVLGGDGAEQSAVVTRFDGTDDPPDIAYLAEVAGSDIYVGVVADNYGTMQKSGFSPTHEEYHEAPLHGKRVSFWVKSDDGNRDGHARKFVREVYVFNTAGSLSTAMSFPR